MALQPMAYRLQAMACSVRGARNTGVNTPESRKAETLIDSARQEVKALQVKLKGLSHEDDCSAYHITADTIKEIESSILELRKELEND